MDMTITLILISLLWITLVVFYVWVRALESQIEEIIDKHNETVNSNYDFKMEILQLIRMQADDIRQLIMIQRQGIKWRTGEQVKEYKESSLDDKRKEEMA